VGTEGKLEELVEVLRLMTSRKDAVSDPRELLLDATERVVKYVSGVFGTKGDEVAILLLTDDRKHLRFAAPRKFADLGTIPITKRDSIAVAIFHRRTGEATNNVPGVRHVSFFESVKLRDKVVPIQKMITVPILSAGEALGVAQVSRKGESPAAAGPDFTAADVKRADDIFRAVASLLADARPERF
jgi:hypothetical protein